MEQELLNKVTADLKEKYPDVGIQSIEVNDNTGQTTFLLEPTKKSLAFIDTNKGGGVVPYVYRDKAAVINRDSVQRQNLDLISKNPFTEDPKESFKRAINYYYTDPLVGPSTNILANLARKGFENDIDDANIKQFYDTWTFDVGFDALLDWIYLDFFKVGHVTTYKVLAKYEPRVSYLSPIPGQKITNKKKQSKTTTGKTKAAKKNIWSKGHLPVSYTVLNPLLVNINGSLLFDKTSVALTPPPELSELLKKNSSELTDEEKALIKALPSDLKIAAEKGGEFKLDPRLVGQITYRKQPYERYARPKALKVFDTIEYKNALKQADLSTLDGITNYILKITIGNDEYPVVSQEELEAVSQLFNTPSKSFDCVWNHTLEIEKIVSPEIDKILGQGKYEQVNDDMTTGLAITRAIIDGGTDINTAEVDLLVKGLMEEVNYARRQVTRWIYREYQQIAEAMNFDRFPKVRWDDGVLMDTILYMNTLSSMVDRRMLSYRTSLESLGFDYPNELKNMEEEVPLVEAGLFGVVGSPWQQSKMGIQPVQNSPKGTPSKGRPTGQPAGKKKTNVNPAKQPGQKASIAEDVTNMTPSNYLSFLDGARSVLSEDDYINFLDWVSRERFSE
ncbi:hypothetical protein KAW18_03565 [candidate division WOR-3 bacterium]|nr:hypothetical protein [candidate division WOR-3 bacterium]